MLCGCALSPNLTREMQPTYGHDMHTTQHLIKDFNRTRVTTTRYEKAIRGLLDIINCQKRSPQRIDFFLYKERYNFH